MNSSPPVWQVSGGPASRTYAQLFLDHGVALIGPGDPGPWWPGRPDGDFDGSYVRRLALEMQTGDWIILRTGTATIHSVGIVASDYLYLPHFDDVNGWDLQHARRVRWAKSLTPYTFGASFFGANPPRLAQVNQPELLEYVRRVIHSPPTRWQTEPLPPLSPEEPALDHPPPAIADLVAHALDLAPLYDDAHRFGERPAEHEMVAHYVVPLLRALGWPLERIALEWRRIDVALFHRLPRTPENCHFIIEAKRLGAGVEGSLQQGIDYLTALGICRDIVVTDGLRYRLYAADEEYQPVAYANLTRLKQPSLALFDRIRRT